MDFLSNTKINFMSLRKAGFTLSSILAIGSILILLLGINLGIDFKGGTMAVSYTHLTLPTKA